MKASPYRRHTESLVAAKTGDPLMDWIATRLDEGASWRSIPGLLSDATDGDVQVTRQSLRSWWLEDDRVDV